ncbi:MAG: hypothetical protein ACMUIE_10830 [Thermoplasmatota archaeon]
MKSTIIALVSFVALAALFAGCLGGEVNREAHYLNLDFDVYDESDTVEITVISGEADWDELKVVIDDLNEVKTAPGTVSRAGDTATFTPVGEIDFTAGTAYRMKVIDIADGTVLFDADTVAKYN